MIAPIYSAIQLVRFALVAALDPLTTAGVYWLQAPEGATLPYCIIQSQDLGGRAEPHLGALGWSGLITVKALASSQGSANGNTQAAAEAIMAAVAPGMDAIVAPTGYDIAVAYSRPIVVPPLSGIWQSGHLWRVILERE